MNELAAWQAIVTTLQESLQPKHKENSKFLREPHYSIESGTTASCWERSFVQHRKLQQVAGKEILFNRERKNSKMLEVSEFSAESGFIGQRLSDASLVSRIILEEVILEAFK